MLAAIALLSSSPAYACKCRAPALEESAKDQALVFTGTIVSVKEKDGYDYEIAVDAVWKGKLPAKLVINTGTGGGDCTKGELGPVGEKWLFTLSADRSMRSCDGSQRSSADAVARVTKVLGAPKRL